jgi:hydroxyacyl-ACP dehydratase HTD2-like protein with hotdog domain
VTTVNAERFAGLRVGEQLPNREYEPDNVQLMLYNASLWNGHRIHFDEPYAKNVEGYPGLVIAGPLLGDWLHQCVEEWLGDDGYIFSIDYSNRAATYIGDVLTAGGEIAALRPEAKEVEVDVYIKNQSGDVVTPGKVVVRFADNG